MPESTEAKATESIERLESGVFYYMQSLLAQSGETSRVQRLLDRLPTHIRPPIERFLTELQLYYLSPHPALSPAVSQLIDQLLEQFRADHLSNTGQPTQSSALAAIVKEQIQQLLQITALKMPQLLALEVQPLLKMTDQAIIPHLIKFVLDVATDEVLSTPDCSVSNMGCLAALVPAEMEQAVRDGNERYVRSMGYIFLDVNGLKSIVDCTDHTVGCNFLKRISYLLKNPNAEVTAFLREHELSMESFTVGGDEFFLRVRDRSARQFFQRKLLNALGKLLQNMIEQDRILRSEFIDYNNDQMVLAYGATEDEQRKLEAVAPSVRAEKIQEIRALLPDHFIPSVSVGCSMLRDGVTRVYAKHQKRRKSQENSPNAFDDFCFTAHQFAYALADNDQQKNKQEYKERLKTEDVKLYFWLMRNKENRDLRQRFIQIQKMIAEVHNEMEEIMRQSRSAADALDPEQAIVQLSAMLEPHSRKIAALFAMAEAA